MTQQTSTLTKLNLLRTDKIICLLIVLTVPFFYLYELVPDKKEVDFIFFKYKSEYYQSINALAWTLIQKLIIIFLLFIWYITNKNWWRYALAAPTAMFIYQSVFLLIEDAKPKDEFYYNSFFVLGFTFLIILILHLISRKIGNKIKLVDINEMVSEEINKIILEDKLENDRGLQK